MSEIITIVVAVVTAFGGLEAIKYFFNRKSNKRINEAEADSAEITVLMGIIDALTRQQDRSDARLKERDAKVDAIYTELRVCQNENLALIKKHFEKELESATKICEVKKCKDRKPESSY